MTLARPILKRIIAMTPPRHDAGHRLSDHDLEAMLERAAEEGARQALSYVGLGGKDAVLTIHDMRSLWSASRSFGAPGFRRRGTSSPPAR
jgi:hypothetical protein